MLSRVVPERRFDWRGNVQCKTVYGCWPFLCSKIKSLLRGHIFDINILGIPGHVVADLMWSNVLKRSEE